MNNKSKPPENSQASSTNKTDHQHVLDDDSPSESDDSSSQGATESTRGITKLYVDTESNVTKTKHVRQPTRPTDKIGEGSGFRDFPGDPSRTVNNGHQSQHSPTEPKTYIIPEPDQQLRQQQQQYQQQQQQQYQQQQHYRLQQHYHLQQQQQNQYYQRQQQHPQLNDLPDHPDNQFIAIEVYRNHTGGRFINPQPVVASGPVAGQPEFAQYCIHNSPSPETQCHLPAHCTHQHNIHVNRCQPQTHVQGVYGNILPHQMCCNHQGRHQHINRP